MAIYFILYILLILGAFFQSFVFKTQKSRRLFCIFAFILIAGMLSLRHPSMGIDLGYGSSEGYLGMFIKIGNCSWKQVFSDTFLNYERGYVIFCKLLSYLSIDPQILMVACAIISVSAISWLIYKYSDSPCLSFIIWMGLPIFTTNFSTLRQVIAIALTVFSYKFIKEKKLVKFILVVLLASTFHKSAIIFLVAYPLYYIKISKLIQYIMAGILPVVYLFRYPLFNILTKLIGKDAVPDNNNALTLFVVFTAIYIFTVIYSDKSNGSGLNNLFWVACFCQAFGGVYSTAMRCGYYFMVYIILLLPQNLSYMKNKLKDSNLTYTVFAGLIFCAFCAFGLYLLYSTQWSMSYPYYFFWEN